MAKARRALGFDKVNCSPHPERCRRVSVGFIVAAPPLLYYGIALALLLVARVTTEDCPAFFAPLVLFEDYVFERLDLLGLLGTWDLCEPWFPYLCFGVVWTFPFLVVGPILGGCPAVANASMTSKGEDW